MTDESSEDEKRDAVLRRMTKLKPMTHAELVEKLKRERAEKGAAPKGGPKKA